MRAKYFRGTLTTYLKLSSSIIHNTPCFHSSKGLAITLEEPRVLEQQPCFCHILGSGGNVVDV